MKKNQAILMVSIMALMAIVMFAPAISADGQKEGTQVNETEYSAQYTIMKLDPETLQEWIERYNSAPQAYIDPKIKMSIEQSPEIFFSLLDHIEYDPVERNQGSCGNCWVWAGTGVLETALDIQEGIKDRLSVQYFTSCYQGGVGEDWACCGGWLDQFADWYQTNGSAISWSNTNAHWQDGSRTCCKEYNLDGSCKIYWWTSVPCESISTSCNYPITNCTATSIETHGVGKETAIANIKNVLHQNKTVSFAYFLPTAADWDNFFDFWQNDPENAIWNPDFSCGHTWVENEGGGHAVLCVGYNDTDPNNSYWIMLNSWGTAGGRPNGLFYLDMDMDYDCYFTDGANYYSFYWETLNVTFEITPIEKGLCWLTEHQNPDGSWQNSVGITSMAALAFLNAGHTEDDPTVNKAIQYILNNRNADGSFGWGTYETSTAIWALVATHNASYNDEIADARDWLVDAQYDEGEGADPTNVFYGGWRYGSSPGDGDLSNTQFALMALSAAGLPSGSDTWTKAVTFTSRSQNDDGGFQYSPVWSLAGPNGTSYGSMTAAGIWSLRLSGVGVGDGRVQDGLTWLTNNEDCSFDDNPVMGASYQYYYYMSIAKALVMCFEDDLICADWYAALSTKLADLQHDDGRWSHYMDDETTTEFALLALQTRQPPAANLWMSIILASNATLTVYDPQGRYARLGDVTIPGATFEIDAEGRQIVNLTELEAGKYRIELKGTADGDYSLTIEGYRDEEQTSSETFEGTIEEGEYQKSDVLVTSMVGALTIYVEEPEPLLVTDLPNVELVSADPTVTSINVTSLNLSEINETYKPEECITPQSAYMVNSTGAGNFTLRFTDIPNANTIIAYKINATNQWIELDATTTADTVTFTMSVEDPPVVFCSGALPVAARVPALTPIGITALAGLLAIVAVGRIRRKR